MSLMRGLALAEVLLTLFLIAVIIGIAMPISASLTLKTKQSQAIVEMTEIQAALADYRATHNAYPERLQQAAPARLVDPWGAPYEYMRIEGDSRSFAARQRRDENFQPINTDYDLYSRGADGMIGSPITALASRDDIVRAGNGEFTGIAEEF